MNILDKIIVDKREILKKIHHPVSQPEASVFLKRNTFLKY
jgi:hypothetical protein